MGNLSFDVDGIEGGKTLGGWLDLSRQAFKSPFAQSRTTAQYEGNIGCFLVGLSKGLEPKHKANPFQVSTKPVVEPLADESLRP
ncbi:MAG TPA: hypothetical protein DDW72_17905 [Afipia sp.]|nr:hypothetical protein [Afipia sp.]